MVQEAALTLVDLVRNLPTDEVENFAIAFCDVASGLSSKQEARTAQHQQKPLRLSNPLPKQKTKAFASSRKRAMTGRGAAEAEERDQIQAGKTLTRERAAAAVVKATAEAANPGPDLSKIAQPYAGLSFRGTSSFLLLRSLPSL